MPSRGHSLPMGLEEQYILLPESLPEKKMLLESHGCCWIGTWIAYLYTSRRTQCCQWCVQDWMCGALCPLAALGCRFIPPHRLWGSDSGGQVRWQTPFPTEPSFQPPRMTLYLLFYCVCMGWGYLPVNIGACCGQRHWLDPPGTGVTGSQSWATWHKYSEMSSGLLREQSVS